MGKGESREIGQKVKRRQKVYVFLFIESQDTHLLRKCTFMGFNS